VCGQTFTNIGFNFFFLESTLKRHGYYCRSRRALSATRVRSCVSCARGKARCDTRRPECSRCKTKGVECQYPANTPKSRGPRTKHNVEAPTEQREIVPSLIGDTPNVENHQEARNVVDAVLDNEIFAFDQESANIGEDFLDWNDYNIDFTEFLDTQTNRGSFQYPASGSLSLARHSTPSTYRTVQAQQAISSPSVFMPGTPTSQVRSLISRPNKRTGAQSVANLILHTLKSYPLMMLRHQTLPPFIHPHSISSEVENDNMEPLNNCLSLVHMISSGIRGSRKLFWKNVRQECEHLFAEVC
jgi:hypothetical protein